MVLHPHFLVKVMCICIGSTSTDLPPSLPPSLSSSLPPSLTSRWLVKSGRTEKAHRVLTRIRQGVGEEGVREELSDIEETLQSGTQVSIRELLQELSKWKISQR